MNPVFLPFRRLLALTCCLLIVHKGISQDSHLGTPDPNQMSFVNFDPSKDVFTISAGRVNIDPADIEGSPFLISGWRKGNVSFYNGKMFKDADLKFNLVKNELQFLKDDKPLLFADAVKAFMILDTADGETRKALFNSGYPSYGMHNTKSFYQVLAMGKNVQLLKYLSKRTAETYEYNVNAKLSYKLTEDLYLYDVKNDKLQFINATANSIEKTLKDIISADVHELVKTKSKKLSENDIVDLINKVNSL